ncbi:substrate-binding periplasmic protein [Kordiimonas aestuarii]|uniref:substrate-binding periplasmic protein n=1 Tax=Kordiimonas aestuarii TaxID=1005925 RepID=UPI0021D2C752|nr:transporter substrate-binding domain-containing protein [Kordiimonas aestuarii]
MRKLFAAGSGVTALVFLFLTFVEARAENPAAQAREATAGTTIFGTVWGYTLAQDGSGFYNDVVHDLMDDFPLKASYQLMPYRRAKSRFLAHDSACLYPSAVAILTAGQHVESTPDLIETRPLFTTRTHIFARRGEKPPRVLADLKGKTVAVPSGSVMHAVLAGTGAELIAVHDETDKARMLLTARVDYITAMLPDAVLVFDALQEPLPTFDERLRFLETGIGIVCHRTPETQTFIKAMDQRITEMNANPAYQTRLERAGIWHDAGESNGDEISLNDIAPAAGRGAGRVAKVAHVHAMPTGLGHGNGRATP